jgi:serine/threonine-protein kinase
MAPEQAVAPKESTTRTDVYGLGAILYALLAGRPPFEADTVLDTLVQVREQEPVPINVNNRHVDRDLETICLKCLDKDPNKRYGSAEALADDLERWLRGEPIQARPIPLTARLWRWCRRNPRTAGLSAMMLTSLILAVGVLGVSTWLIWREKEETRSALTRAEAKTRWARRAVEDMYTQVAEKWLADEPGMSEVQRQFLLKALQFYEELAKEKNTEPRERLETALAYRRLGSIRGALTNCSRGAEADLKRAEKEFEQAIAILRLLVEEYPGEPDYQRELVRSLRTWGELLRNSCRFDQADGPLNRALLLTQELAAAHPEVSENQQELAESLLSLCRLWVMTGREKKAEEAFRQAMNSQRILAARFPHQAKYRARLACTLSELGEVLYHNGRLDDAQATFSEVVGLREKLLAEQRQAWRRANLGGSYHALALIMLDRGNYPKAKECLDPSLQLRRQVRADFPTSDPFRHALALTLATLGRYCTQTNQPEKAAEAYLQALGYLRTLVDEFPSYPHRRQELAVVLHNLAWLYLRAPEGLRDSGKALTLAREAMELVPDNVTYWTLCGAAYYRQGDWARAREMFQRVAQVAPEQAEPLRGWVSDAMSLRAAAERAGHKAAVLNWFFLAMTHQRRGESGKAENCHRRALQEWQTRGKVLSSCWVEDLVATRHEAEEVLGIKPRVAKSGGTP